MDIYVLLLSISTLITFLLFIYITNRKSKGQLQRFFGLTISLTLVLDISVLCQLLIAQKYSIPPIYFDYFSYIGGCFMPVAVFFVGKTFASTKLKMKKIYLLYLIEPIIALLVLWTNDFHHLFFVNYSTNMNDIITGPMHSINSIYSYLFLFLGVFYLLRYSIKNAGFFSRQSILILLGISIPLVVNILGTFKIIPMTIYITPISFSFTMLFFTLALFKFNFLGVTPIALQRIVDRMSDSYIVLGDNLEIIDFNHTLITTFKIKNESALRGKNFEKLINGTNFYNDFEKVKDKLVEVQSADKTFYFELYIKEVNKYFNVEINSILSKGQSLGTLILFKDITQHKRDIQTIKDTQDSLMESERLSSLGQLIGGIAHNLKTPIMSIAGAAEGLTDLVKEYDESIDDPTVNSQDHHEIAQDMSKWIKKIKEYSEYMSDVITAVKGQAVVMANEDDITFTVSELIKRINILMKHELKNAIINLNVDCKVDDNTQIHGDVNNLVQVINNMISNAIQAYNGKTEESIEFVIEKQGNNVVFSIEDHAGGLPDKVKDKLFKEMITTKGKNGTGLGLYMSYSTIKAHFNGNITYETEKGKGTKFNILIPVG